MIMLAAIAVVIAVVFLSFWVEMLLWNNVLADVFVQVPEVSYWEMAGISILCMLLFKSTPVTRSKD